MQATVMLLVNTYFPLLLVLVNAVVCLPSLNVLYLYPAVDAKKRPL